MPVIVGVPRSGTTLLRVMLDAHPELAIPPETGFVLDACRLDGEGDELRKRLLDTITRFHTWGVMGVSASALRDRLRSIEPFDVAEGVRAFYRLYAARFGKRRFGDKTPMYRFHLEELEGLLPEARFIHIIRDGRDVALSVRGFWFAPGEDLKTLAADWRTGIVATRAQGSLVKRYLELRFEDLIISPERELRRVCQFLELRFDPPMLRYPETATDRLREIGVGNPDPRNPVPKLAAQAPDSSRLGTWKHEMSRRERRQFKRVAGKLLRELGYES